MARTSSDGLGQLGRLGGVGPDFARKPTNVGSEAPKTISEIRNGNEKGSFGCVLRTRCDFGFRSCVISSFGSEERISEADSRKSENKAPECGTARTRLGRVGSGSSDGFGVARTFRAGSASSGGLGRLGRLGRPLRSDDLDGSDGSDGSDGLGRARAARTARGGRARFRQGNHPTSNRKLRKRFRRSEIRTRVIHSGASCAFVATSGSEVA